MRVLSLLSLLCLCVLGVSGQYIVDGTASTGSSSSKGWALTGIGANPTLNFTAGNTYNFDISAVFASHPFAFSSAENAGLNTITPIDTTVYNVSTNGTGCGTTNGGFTNTGGGCVVNIAIAANATNATIFYKCTFHSFMTAKINIWAAPAAGNTTNTTTVAPTTAAPTTVAPTTLAPTTVAPGGNTTGNATTAAPTTLAPTTNAPTTGAPTTPAPTTGQTITSNSFRITGNAATAAYWIFTANNVQYANPTLTVTAGSAVTFSFELPKSSFHPFGFSNNSSPTIASTQLNDTSVFPDFLQTYTTTCATNYFTNIKTVYANVNTTCTLTVPAAQVNVGTLYYRCARHPLMVGTINVVAAPGSSSSTGGNSASTITLSGLTIVVAFIAALMA